MIRKGKLEKVSRGIYFDLTFNDFDELYFLQKQFKKKVSVYQIKMDSWVLNGYNACRNNDGKYS
ncbi:hypothetical protein RGT18_15030 [Solobacterium moorei]|nr:hypothetical protein RGT18_15030 [Solobacterium moorei]